jgi:hypothetical protein
VRGRTGYRDIRRNKRAVEGSEEALEGRKMSSGKNEGSGKKKGMRLREEGSKQQTIRKTRTLKEGWRREEGVEGRGGIKTLPEKKD